MIAAGASLARTPRVARARRTLDVYGDAGGGLLANGLAFSAIFALLPAMLLVVGLIGFVINEPIGRERMVYEVARHIPPLEELLRVALEEVARGAVSFSIVGVAGLAWGASRFYAALDDGFARIFSEGPRRGVLSRTARGLVSVAVLLIAFLGALVLTSVASFLEASVLASQGGGSRIAARVISPLLAAAAFGVAIAFVYRLVPTKPLAWRAIAGPAVAVGVALAAFTDLFVYVAPRLIGTVAVYGAFVAVFAALVWLSVGFQLLLLGASWIRASELT